MVLEEGVYEGFTNYDIPFQLPSFWTQHRRDNLSISAQRECVFYYQPCSGSSDLTARTRTRLRNRLVQGPRRAPPNLLPAAPSPAPARALKRPHPPAPAPPGRKKLKTKSATIKKVTLAPLLPGQRRLGPMLQLEKLPSPLDRPESLSPANSLR